MSIEDKEKSDLVCLNDLLIRIAKTRDGVIHWGKIIAEIQYSMKELHCRIGKRLCDEILKNQENK